MAHSILDATEFNVFSRLPFTFVVPSNLLPHACHHKCLTQELRNQHLQLPPSLGRTYLQDQKSQHRDNMTPDTVCVSYSIQFHYRRVTCGRGAGSSTGSISRLVNIQPPGSILPHFFVPDKSEYYCLRQDVQLKTGVFGRPFGHLTASAVQPRAIIWRHLPEPKPQESLSAVDVPAIIPQRIQLTCPPPFFRSRRS
jgi:hypothetical protein